MPLKNEAPPTELLPDDIANVVLFCPAGKDGGVGQVAAEFAQTEMGQKHLPEVLENIDKMEKAGFSREEAISMGLGSIALKNQDGSLMRQESAEPQKKTL